MELNEEGLNWYGMVTELGLRDSVSVKTDLDTHK